VAALALLAALAVLEWYYRLDVSLGISLGIFYTIPVIVAAAALNRVQVLLFAVLCAAVRGTFTPAISELEQLLKFLMAGIAYCGSGLFVVEVSNNRRRLIEHYGRLKLEQELRRRAEEQLRILAESSPAAIFTLNADALVVAANQATHEMLGFQPSTLVGKSVQTYFPVFADALKLTPGARPVRTSVTGWARRQSGQVFPIQAWFSIYGQQTARYLAAIVVDVSEDLRDRERENFRHLLDYNRLLAGAVSHEIRNLCSAISVVCSNLSKRSDFQTNVDFEALTSLVDGLSKLASFELSRKGSDVAPRTDVRAPLDQVRVVIEPDWAEIEGTVTWNVPESVPAVQADSHALLQIFLNLAQNSLRAVSGEADRNLLISVEQNTSDIKVVFTDSGPGVADPERLFHPFRPDADGSGLGLYISRELARSFGGDLICARPQRPCTFEVLIPIAQQIRGSGNGAN
jgi:PAS domain S-box-containing protein